MHYNWHRFYDPETGRYISADPIGLDGGMNLFAYANQDPINYFDITGLKCETKCLDRPGNLKGNVLSHKVFNADAAQLYWRNVKCPETCPNLTDTNLTSEGAPPYSPAEHSFPDRWVRTQMSEKRVSYSVPSRTVLNDRMGIERVRLCLKCCDDEECKE